MSESAEEMLTRIFNITERPSLRDQLAMAALNKIEWLDDCSMAAEKAYKCADAMLEARKK